MPTNIYSFWNNIHLSHAHYATLINPTCSSMHGSIVYIKHLHSLSTQCHNKVVWEICTFISSSLKSRFFILMNIDRFNNNPPEPTIISWLLSYTCTIPQCHCNAQFKPNVFCICGLQYRIPPSLGPSLELTIQFIEFTYCNDKFSQDRINAICQNTNHGLIKFLP